MRVKSFCLPPTSYILIPNRSSREAQTLSKSDIQTHNPQAYAQALVTQRQVSAKQSRYSTRQLPRNHIIPHLTLLHLPRALKPIASTITTAQGRNTSRALRPRSGGKDLIPLTPHPGTHGQSTLRPARTTTTRNSQSSRRTSAAVNRRHGDSPRATSLVAAITPSSSMVPIPSQIALSDRSHCIALVSARGPAVLARLT
jgi:hypothetical protein